MPQMSSRSVLLVAAALVLWFSLLDTSRAAGESVDVTGAVVNEGVSLYSGSDQSCCFVVQNWGIQGNQK